MAATVLPTCVARLRADVPSDIVAFGSSFFLNRQNASDPSWIEYLAIDLGVPLDNRAVGGSSISAVFQQIDDYLAMNVPSPNTLFVVAPGGTPYFCEPPCAPTPADIDWDKIEEEEKRMMEQLVEAGARSFLIPEAIIGFVPRAETVWPGQRSMWIDIMTDFNTKQRASMDVITELTSATFISPSWFELAQTASDNPHELGFADGKTPGESSPFPEQHFSWDGVHQTSAFHRLLADDALLDLIPDRERPATQVPSVGGILSENFDEALGSNGRLAGQPLPEGWSVTGDRRLTFSNHVTRSFSTRTGILANRMLGDGDVFNAGLFNDADRALVTSISRSGVGSEIQLNVDFPDGSPRALRMTFDLEMWGADNRIREPGTAAFDLTLHSKGKAFGVISGESVSIDIGPSSKINGNEPAFRSTYDSGVIGLHEQSLEGLDIRWNTVAELGAEGWAFGVDNFQLITARSGDANVDGYVNFDDFLILSSNYGQDGMTWEGGDFDADNSVLFADFLLLSRNFGVSSPIATAVPEPHTFWLLLIGGLGVSGFLKSRQGRIR